MMTDENQIVQTTTPATPRRMLPIEEVLTLVPLSRATLFRKERAGTFPASTYISANRRIWYADEIAAWQENLPAHRRVSRRAGKKSAA
jgi:prophage regulatory protein